MRSIKTLTPRFRSEFRGQHSVYFLDPSDVSSAVEICVQKSVHNFESEVWSQDAPSEREHIRIVIPTRQESGKEVITIGGAHPRNAIGDHRHSDTGTANQDTALQFAVGDRSGEGPCEIRIIYGFLGVGPEIHDLVARFRESLPEDLLERISVMVGSDAYPHQSHPTTSKWLLPSSSW